MYSQKVIDNIFLPVIMNSEQNIENEGFKKIIKDHPDVNILNQFPSQKKELFKIQNPKSRLSSDDLENLYNEWQKNKNVDSEGAWIYYPWTNRLVHILDKDEFILLRTSRNQYKISPDEQSHLFNKKIGIIGLSVGSAVAISIATERICGKLKLADFDTIELSNLNRLKTGIHNIGLNKCIVTAREIAEIDPFLEVECYLDGVTEQNMPDFLLENGKLDVLIDECDSLEIKISCREMAKTFGIPVVMETSDRGMLDVERFDLEATRPILHGFLEGFPKERLTNISIQDRLPIFLRIVDAVNGSHRGKASFLEVGQTISTLPQLASAVTLGGGVVTDVTRRILLEQFTDSGRYYVDLETIIKNKEHSQKPGFPVNPHSVFGLNDAIRIADSIPYENSNVIPQDEEIRQIVEAGSHAPSSGNDQPWKWLYKNGRLHLFHDKFRSFSFANVNNMSANIALGAAFENVVLKSRQLGYNVKGELFPLGEESALLAALTFSMDQDRNAETVFAPELVNYIFSRSSNRNKDLFTELSDHENAALQEAAQSIAGARLHYITERNAILEAAAIVAECELVTLLNEHGHHDFFKRNVKWTPAEITDSNDGMSVQVLGYNASHLAALSMIRDEKIAQILKQIGGGNLLADNVQETLTSASSFALLTFSQATQKNYFLGGRAVQRMWLRAEQLDIAIQPLFSPLFLFQRLKSGSGLAENEIEKLRDLRKRFRSIINLDENLVEVFLFKLSKAEKKSIQTKRLPLKDILFMTNDKV